MVHAIHTRAPVQLSDGQVYRNPRFFSGPVEGATKATIDPGFPEIAEAYAEAKVPVTIIGAPEPKAGAQRRTRGQATAE